MTEREPVETKNLDQYGDTALDWSRASGALLNERESTRSFLARDALTAPYTAPSGGSPPWNLYRMVVHTAFGVASAEPSGATRWRFTD